MSTIKQSSMMQCNGENIALTFVPKACALESFNVSFFRKWSHIKWNNNTVFAFQYSLDSVKLSNKHFW